MCTWPLLFVLALVPTDSTSVFGDRLVWLPMTGATGEQIADAARSGYDTVLWKASPGLLPDGRELDFTAIEKRLAAGHEHGLKCILAVLGESGLGREDLFDRDEQGRRLTGELDPFNPAAMARLEQVYAQVIQRYVNRPDVVGFAPTWGIYGEAGFRSFTAGRSPHALDRFNEWRAKQALSPLEALPSRREGPNTEYNRFIRFRYCYMEEQWDAMFRRLRGLAGGKPVGTWQELYPVIGYLYHMVEVPSADFALYESCFPFQTSHHPRKTLAETMGFRYRCDSAEDYRDYYLPLLARKRGEGQHFMGCQLNNEYASNNYKWPPHKAAEVRFDQWEDRFAPYLQRLHRATVETPSRDVLLVFPTYAAAALSDAPVHSVDAMTIDVLLRMFGCQITRCGSPALDKLTVEQMNGFRLIVIPCSDYLLSETLAKLTASSATVLFTGCFGQSLDAQYVPFGTSREIAGVELSYVRRPAGGINLEKDHPFTRQLGQTAVMLPEDESFEYTTLPPTNQILLTCDGHPLLSTSRYDRFIFIHGHLFAGLAHDPQRRPAQVGGSADPSANEVDLWGPYSSTKAENLVGQRLIRNILDAARVDYRVLNPRPRGQTRYLGDHMEQASISANIAYNNTDIPQELHLRLPYRPRNWSSNAVDGRYETRVSVPPFSYILLEPETPAR